MADDGSETFRSLHDGAAAFGRGCFLAIRNVLSHEYGEAAEPPEQQALEYLAAFSVLARWISDASVERVDVPTG
jgi:putative copper export protein